MLAPFPIYWFLDNEFILYLPVNCFIIMNLDLDIFDMFYSSIAILLIDSQSVPCLASRSLFSLDAETLLTWPCRLVANLLLAFTYSWNYFDVSYLKLPCTFIYLRIIKTLAKDDQWRSGFHCCQSRPYLFWVTSLYMEKKPCNTKFQET